MDDEDCNVLSGGGKGGRGACAPGGTLEEGGIWRGENMEF